VRREQSCAEISLLTSVHLNFISPGNSLIAAVPWLINAETEYKKIDLYSSLADVQYFLSVVYHNLDDHQARNAAVARHVQTNALIKKAEGIVVEDDVIHLWSVVAEIGAALAARPARPT
jgi:anaphase-promoting complex subunit 5